MRFKVPDNTSIVVNDRIKGPVEFNSSNIGGDFIIIRSDGVPVFNYIVIIDDALMKISLVIRGDDHLSNTPKQLLVARALGLPEPEYAHLPLIMGPDRSKLSKRHGITSVEMYRRQGYLPEALMNYMAMLGWASESGDEILPLDAIISQIDLNKALEERPHIRLPEAEVDERHVHPRVSGPGPYRPLHPLHQGSGLRHRCPSSAQTIEDIVTILRKSCELLSDIGGLIGIFLDEVSEPDTDADAMLKTDEGEAGNRGRAGTVPVGAQRGKFRRLPGQPGQGEHGPEGEKPLHAPPRHHHREAERPRAGPVHAGYRLREMQKENRILL